MQKIELSHAFHTTLPETDALARVRDVLVVQGHATNVGVIDDWMVFRIGSRLWFRVWGLRGLQAMNRLPSILQAKTVSVDGGTSMVARLTSDEGPYLVRLSTVDAAYGRLFATITERLARALV